MADFYGTIQGHRGMATRCGSKNSGIRATLNTWTNSAEIHLDFDEKKEDLLTINTSEKLKTMINGIEHKSREDVIAILMNFKYKIEKGEIKTDTEIKEFVTKEW